MEPYIKESSPLRGDQRPGVVHAKGTRRMDLRRQKADVKATRRALKKAARREGRREIEATD